MSDKQYFCSNCGEKLDINADIEECPKCHTALHRHSEHKQPKPTMIGQLPYKSPGTAALIGFLGGLVGLPGIGQIYVGRVRRGGLILFFGVIIDILIGVGFLGIFNNEQNIVLMESGQYVHDPEAIATAKQNISKLSGGLVFMFIIYIIFFAWSIRDAMHRAREFNETVKTTGEEPW